MNTNWGLLLGLIFATIAVCISCAYLITYIYRLCTRPKDQPWTASDMSEKSPKNEKVGDIGLPRPVTARTVPETPVTGTAIPFRFSRPAQAIMNRISQLTISEHMAAGALQTPSRTHRRTRSSYMHSRAQSRQMYPQQEMGHSRQVSDL